MEGFHGNLDHQEWWNSLLIYDNQFGILMLLARVVDLVGISNMEEGVRSMRQFSRNTSHQTVPYTM